MLARFLHVLDLFHWTLFFLLELGLLATVGNSGGALVGGHGGSVQVWRLGVSISIAAALLANAIWISSQTRKLNASLHLSPEDRADQLNRLRRRMWLPLLAVVTLWVLSARLGL